MKPITLASCLALVLLCSSAAIMATQALTDETSLRCTACHDKAGSKLLTDQGKYFESMRTLDGYEAINDEFGRCTSCHVKKPGSPKLTKEGKRFAEVVNNMKELREWLKERHPMPPAGSED